MIANLHPAAFLLLGGALLPLLRGRARQTAQLALPTLGLVHVLGFAVDQQWTVQLGGFEAELLRADKLSWLFGVLFHIAALLSSIYALHLKDRLQPSTGLLYAGSAVAAVFAGDLIVLFVCWELMALTSVCQVWASRTSRALGAGTRYLVIHVSSGLLLLAGSALQFHQTGSLAFGPMGLEDLAGLLIFLSFGIKCAFPLLHNWLIDAYPEATPTGTVFLSSFTTKVAVYALARGFAGIEALVWIGAAMAMFPIFYAVIENDLRRVLGYSMINQVGFMVTGIGLGPGLGLNGAVAHAFTDIIFKGLLFMSMGAVLLRTGKINGSELGGLYKSMPITAGLCLVGAASISAFPLFSGFISKSLVLAAAAEQGQLIVWLMLLFASAGVFHHAGIKIPFFAFFAHDSGIRCKEAPANMLVAMGIAAALCVLIGLFPQVLYQLLPDSMNYAPYTYDHVIQQLQLLFFSALAFVFMRRVGIYPPELPSTNLDSDWVYRRLMPTAVNGLTRVGQRFLGSVLQLSKAVLAWLLGHVEGLHASGGFFSRAWTTGKGTQLVLLSLFGLLLYLLLSHLIGDPR